MTNSRYHHPSVHDLSPGSLRVWLLVGIGLVAVALVALRPLLLEIEMRTRLAVAEQNLVTYRGAVIAYVSENSNVGSDELRFESHKERITSGQEALPTSPATSQNMDSGENLGQKLIAQKKIDQISFPLGARDLVPPSSEEMAWQPNRPEIRAVAISELVSHFKDPKLFSSARSGRVAVLVVPFLSGQEAEAIQKMLGGIHQKEESRSATRADCFFTRSSVEGKFNGWIYLSDL